MSTRSERTADKSQNELHNKVLKTLMQRADNRKCADCKKNDPRWASWNLGVFMCIRCSGIHRSLGTHISKVKSADLDTWTAEQVQNMVRWGNAKANVYWEHALPQGTEIPEQKIEQWIRAKYERKQYAMKGDLPDPDTIPLPAGIADVKLPAPFARTNAALPAQTAAPSTSLINPAPQAAPAASKSAAADLFDAFQAAPTTQTTTTAASQPAAPLANLNSIMSLYATAPANTTAAIAVPGNNFMAAPMQRPPQQAPMMGGAVPNMATGLNGLAGLNMMSNPIPAFSAAPMATNNTMNGLLGGFGAAVPQPTNTFASQPIPSFTAQPASSGGIPDFLGLGQSKPAVVNNPPPVDNGQDIWGDFQS